VTIEKFVPFAKVAEIQGIAAQLVELYACGMQHETRIVVEPAEPVPLETTPPEVITPSISVAPQPVVRGLGAKRRKRAQNERYRERQRSKGLKRLVFTIPASAVEWVSAMTSEIIDCYISAMMPVIEVSVKPIATPVSPAGAREVSRALSRPWALAERLSGSVSDIRTKRSARRHSGGRPAYEAPRISYDRL